MKYTQNYLLSINYYLHESLVMKMAQRDSFVYSVMSLFLMVSEFACCIRKKEEFSKSDHFKSFNQIRTMFNGLMNVNNK